MGNGYGREKAREFFALSYCGMTPWDDLLAELTDEEFQLFLEEGESDGVLLSSEYEDKFDFMRKFT